MIPERDRIKTVMTTAEIAAAMNEQDYSAEMLLQHLVRNYNQLERELSDHREWSSKLADAADDLRSELAETAKDYLCLAELLDGHDATECRENLLVLKSDLKRMEGFAKTYRLRADEAEDKLAAERALADRLAEALNESTEGFGDRMSCEESCQCAGRRIVKVNKEAISAWKEARRGAK